MHRILTAARTDFAFDVIGDPPPRTTRPQPTAPSAPSSTAPQGGGGAAQQPLPSQAEQR